MILEANFEGKINDSIQVGDIVYYMATQGAGGFTTSNADNAVMLGAVTELIEDDVENTYQLKIDYSGSTPPSISSNAFYMFSKDNTVNIASVMGYYTEVQFVNNSTVKSEMFSVGSTVQYNSRA
jgi:hypothetical protein